MFQDSYAVVAYIPGRLGGFIDRLRQRFDPALAAWLAHVTILPPRALPGSLDHSLDAIRQQTATLEPFDVSIQGVKTFWPVSAVVYLGVSGGAEQLNDLHTSLNSGVLESAEPHPYIPHVTIAQELPESDIPRIMDEVGGEWERGPEPTFHVESLYLVKKTPDNRWQDLAPIHLGGRLASCRS
jgi:2'-5' RNA ligase